MTHEASGYGLWTLVVLNSALFLMFAFSFFKPNTARDWRTGFCRRTHDRLQAPPEAR